MPTRGYSRGGSPPVAQTEAADTSGAPVTVTLPALAGLEDGYIVRVYDAGSNASANNITIEDADSVEVDTITDDDGERFLVVVLGAWEVRGYLPLPVDNAALLTAARDAGALFAILSDTPTLLSTTDKTVAGTANHAVRYTTPVSRTVDRCFELVAHAPDTASPGNTSYLQAGDYNSANSFGFLRYPGAGASLAWYNKDWTSYVQLDTTANFRNKWFYFSACYDASAALFTLYWNINGAGEQSTTFASANEGSAVNTNLLLGGTGTLNPVPNAAYLYLAGYNTLPSAGHRSAIYAALGW